VLELGEERLSGLVAQGPDMGAVDGSGPVAHAPGAGRLILSPVVPSRVVFMGASLLATMKTSFPDDHGGAICTVA